MALVRFGGTESGWHFDDTLWPCSVTWLSPVLLRAYEAHCHSNPGATGMRLSERQAGSPEDRRLADGQWLPAVTRQWLPTSGCRGDSEKAHVCTWRVDTAQVYSRHNTLFENVCTSGVIVQWVYTLKVDGVRPVWETLTDQKYKRGCSARWSTISLWDLWLQQGRQKLMGAVIWAVGAVIWVARAVIF